MVRRANRVENRVGPNHGSELFRQIVERGNVNIGHGPHRPIQAAALESGGRIFNDSFLNLAAIRKWLPHFINTP